MVVRRLAGRAGKLWSARIGIARCAMCRAGIVIARKLVAIVIVLVAVFVIGVAGVVVIGVAVGDQLEGFTVVALPVEYEVHLDLGIEVGAHEPGGVLAVLTREDEVVRLAVDDGRVAVFVLVWLACGFVSASPGSSVRLLTSVPTRGGLECQRSWATDSIPSLGG